MNDTSLAAAGMSLRSGLFMCIAMAAFIVNDAIGKWILPDTGVGQFIFVRGVFASLLLIALLAILGRLQEAAHIFEAPLLWRAVLDFVATVLFMLALLHMPLGDLTALQQAAPLAGAVLAWIILKETFGWRRLIAILLGLLGVLLVVKPGYGGFSLYVLSGLASMLASAFRDVVTRRIASHVSSFAVALANAVVVCAGGLAITLFEGFRPLSLDTAAGIGLGAVFVVVGYLFFILAIRIGDIASTAPFRYTNILWALLLGWLVFDDIPDTVSFVGMALIAAAGLFTVYREIGLRAQTRSQK